MARKRRRAWDGVEAREPWRDTTVDLLNDLTWEVENGGSMEDVKRILERYQESISRMYQLGNPEKWANFTRENALELGAYPHEPFSEKAADRMDIPYYLMPMLPKGAHVWTSYGEEISYDKSQHSLAVDPYSSRLELKCL